MSAKTSVPPIVRKASVIIPILGLLFIALCASSVYFPGFEGVFKSAKPLGLLLMAVGIPVNVLCLLMVLRQPIPDTDEEMSAESRSVKLTLLVLLMNFPVAAFCFFAFGWIFKWPLCVVSLDNASSRNLAQVALLEPNGKGVAWTALTLPAGESATARFTLRKEAGEGGLSLMFRVAGSSQTCGVDGHFSNLPGHGHVRVKQDLTCESQR